LAPRVIWRRGLRVPAWYRLLYQNGGMQAVVSRDASGQGAAPPARYYYVFGHRVTYVFDESILIEPKRGLPILIKRFGDDGTELNAPGETFRVQSGETIHRPDGSHQQVTIADAAWDELTAEARDRVFNLAQPISVQLEKDFTQP
jgi:hypothetical protein